MTGNKTAYLLVILDENGDRKSVGLYSEPHPTMSMKYTSALVMEHSAETYSQACDEIVESIRLSAPYRAWLLTELRGAPRPSDGR